MGVPIGSAATAGGGGGGGDLLSGKAAKMRESLLRSQSITENMVTILGSFDHRLSALETAMRPTQVPPLISPFSLQLLWFWFPLHFRRASLFFFLVLQSEQKRNLVEKLIKNSGF